MVARKLCDEQRWSFDRAHDIPPLSRLMRLALSQLQAAMSEPWRKANG
jgi:hypothetical protein